MNILSLIKRFFVLLFICTICVFGGVSAAIAACTTNEIDVAGDGSVCEETKFTVETTSIAANGTFLFNISASGTFYVDCGTNGVLSGDGVSGKTITRSGTTAATYTCTYSTAGTKTLRFAGLATGYATSSDQASAAISFFGTTESPLASSTLVSSLSGSIGSVFPTLGQNSGEIPIFRVMCNTCSNLTTISANLFSGVTGATAAMFRSTFNGCSKLTAIPDGLFSGVSGAAAEMFRSTFTGCSKIAAIPDGLFSGVYGTAEYMFSSTFAGCSKIAAIPDGLFAGVTGASEGIFSWLFEKCSNLDGYIPSNTFAGLISNNSPTASGMWNYTFSNVSKMTFCPAGMMQYTTGYESSWPMNIVSCVESNVTCTGANYVVDNECVPCPTEYSYDTSNGKTSIHQCKIHCDAGTWIASANATTCSDVGIGHYIGANDVGYGYKSPRKDCASDRTTTSTTGADASACVCAGATFENSGTCVDCPAGYDYNTTPGKTSIGQCEIHCDAGTYLANVNAPMCSNVGIGYYASASTLLYGQTGTRNACSAGLVTATDHSTSVEDCIQSNSPCTGATYYDNGTCVACPTGYDYNETDGKVSVHQCQKQCAAGTYIKTAVHEYTLIEYLENTGTSYVDTGVNHGTANIRGELRIGTGASAITANSNILGTQGTGAGYSFGWNKGFKMWVESAGNNITGANYALPKNSTFDIKYELTGTTRQIYWGNNYDHTLSGAHSGLGSQKTIHLFESGNHQKSREFKGRIYYYRLYEGDDLSTVTLVHEFLPARRNSDNQLGMYDTVDKVFVPVVGSTMNGGSDLANDCVAVGKGYYATASVVDYGSVGSRTPCPAGTYSDIENGTSLASCIACPGATYNGILGAESCVACPTGYTSNTTAGKTSVNQCQAHCAAGTYVPAEYTKLEYIEATGTQYMDTGLYMNGLVNPVMSITMQYTNTTPTNQWTGFSNSGSAKNFAIGIDGSGSFKAKAGTVYDSVILGTADTDKHTFVLNTMNNTASMDGITSTINVTDFSVKDTLKIAYAGNDNPIKAKIYSFSLISDGFVIMTMVPARRDTDGALGMLNTLTNVFFPNVGTGTFIAGPDTNTTTSSLGCVDVGLGRWIGASTVNYGDVGNTPNLCPIGTYSGITNGTSLSSCTSCTGATYNDETGMAACKLCPTGYDANLDSGKTADTQCQIACSAGTWLANANDSICSDAGLGHWSAASTVYYGDIGTRTACPIGTYNDTTTGTSAAACTSCAGATYSDETGLGACKACPIGYTANIDSGKTASTQCQIHCDAGTYITPLPAGYVPLEYIEATGTQYLNTNVVPNTLVQPIISLTVQYTQVENGKYSGSNDTLFMGINASGEFFVRAGAAANVVSFGVADTNKHTFVLNKQNGTVSLDNTVSPISNINLSSSRQIQINRNSFSDSTIGKAKYYHFSVIDNGVEIRNMIPARRESDNVVGMYDTINGVFYPNVGSGTFIAGSDGQAGVSSCINVGTGHYSAAATMNYGSATNTRTACPIGTYNDTTTGTSAAACTSCVGATYNDETGMAACKACPVGYTANIDSGKTASTQCQIHCDAGTYITPLPSGYMPLEYIETTGTQYINTGVLPNSLVDPIISLTVQYTQVESGKATGTRSNDNMLLMGIDDSGQFYARTGNATTNVVSFGAADTNKHTFVLNKPKGTASLDDTTLTMNFGNYNINNSFRINTVYYLESSSTGSAKYYNFNIISNGVEIRNMVPARRESDSVIGMYDTINGVFYPNVGSGTFIAGSDGQAGASSCIDVGTGHYSTASTMNYNSATNTRAACPVGTYSDVTNAAACTSCVGATYGDETGLAACKACPTGYTANTTSGKTADTQCQIACSAGTWLATANDATCSDAGLGHWVAASTVYYGDVSDAPTACPIGTYSDVTTGASAEACTSCAGATYNDETGMAACKACPTGYTANITSGKTADTQCQITCSDGTYLKPFLPSMYTQLEYIESDANTPFMTVGLTTNQLVSPVMSATLQYTVVENNKYTGSDSRLRFGTNGSGKFYAGAGSNTVTFGNADTDKHTFVIDAVNSTATMDRMVKSLTVGSLDGTIGINGSGSSAKYYHFHLISNGVAVRDMWPARRNSDNAIGMYDMVNGVFYTGTFTAGPNNIIGQSSCTNAGAGHYALGATLNYGQTNVNARGTCAAGTYASSETATSCTTCTGATYSPEGSASCYQCPVGYDYNTTDGKTSVNQCQIHCAAGKWAGLHSSEYDLLQYIEATGSQYIDTGINVTALVNPIVSLTMQYTMTENGKQNGQQTTNKFFKMGISMGGRFMVQAGGQNADVLFGDADTDRHTFIINMANDTGSVDNTTLPLILGDYAAAQTFYIGTVSQTGSPGSEKYNKAKYYAFSIENNGVDIMKLVPARRKSDNAVGMYDVVNDTFYENSGANPFVAGPVGVNDVVASFGYVGEDGECTDVGLGYWSTASTINFGDTPTRNACPIGTYNDITNGTSAAACKSCAGATYNDETAAATCKACPNGYDYNTTNGKDEITDCQIHCDAGTYLASLPSGYTRLEYVQTTGTQYINTGVAMNTLVNPTMSLTMQYDSTRPNQQNGLFSNSISFKVGISASASNFMCHAGGDYTDVQFGPADTNRHTFVLDTANATCSLDNNTLPITVGDLSTMSSSAYFHIGFRPGNNASAIYDTMDNAKYYHFSITSNGVLIRDMVPAKRDSDDTVGMYDLVNDVFYPNAGSGDIVAGRAGCINVGTGYWATASTLNYGVLGTRNACPIGYDYSNTGAGAQTDCYAMCTANEVPHATAFTGNNYYGGINTCAPLDSNSCDENYHYVAANGNTLALCAGDTITINWGDANGGVYESTSCEYGGTLSTPATAPTKRGHTFVGWVISSPQSSPEA